MANSNKSVFEILNNINVNEHTETKEVSGSKLTYLSWAWAWAEVKKAFPDAVYEIEKFNGIPYAYDPLTGYMVYTKVTIGGITHEMWLPVMDGQNRAMKAEAYQIQTKYKTITVQPATMFDVNKAIMRCLVKNLAMFGLGLYIYAGEDLPEDADQADVQAASAPQKKAAAKKATQHICENCKNPVTDAEGHTADQIVAATKKQFNGHTFCMACAHAIKAEMDRSKAEVAPPVEMDERLQLPFPIE